MLIIVSINFFYLELVCGVECSCFECGYSFVFCNIEGDE